MYLNEAHIWSCVQVLKEQVDDEKRSCAINDIEKFVKDRLADERSFWNKPGMHELIAQKLSVIAENEGKTLCIAEVGAHPEHSYYKKVLNKHDNYYVNLKNWNNHPRLIEADITNCPNIQDNTYDIVFSVSVFEHIAEPWKAASEISRITKPGGLTCHFAPFSFFYHESPIDYWRYSPKALEFLFGDFDTIEAEWISRNRRHNNTGSSGCKIDKWEKAFSEDSWGGWRENWFSWYVGRKRKAQKQIY